ncbi:glycosyltransferase [Ligilactobacillus apodemi]|nr:glycosyltransferase [Ligilactobacillus apodemi]
MKLKFLCMELSGIGGTETVLVKVLNYLCREHDIELILTSQPEQPAFIEKFDPKVKVTIYAGKYNRLFNISRRFLTATNDTCFISLSPKMIKLGAKIRASLQRKYRLISWIHFSLDDQDMFDAKADLPYADGHLAISSVIKNQLCSYGIPEEKIFLIFNPIEPVTTELSATDTTNFFYAGRIIFEGQKNLKEMLDGLSLVPNATLDVYGTGNDLALCQSYAEKLGINARITWHGFTKNLWSQIDTRPTALLLTSKYEGLPMIMLETIAHGVPVISSQFNGYQDVLIEGVNGFSYPQKDVNSLATQMKKIATNPLPTASVKESITKFYPQNYFKKFANALHQLTM